MGEIRVGACSWTDKELLASGWYPKGRRDAEGRLRHYASRFPLVEVDATYYALPSTRNSELWVARTPAGFRFDVKAFSLLTGHPTRSAAMPADLRPALARKDDPELLDEVWARFAGALEPLRRADRLGTLLFQFPPWLAPDEQSRALLRACRERTAGWPVAVEFRHPDWWRPELAAATSGLLTELGTPAVAVDTAQGLPTSVPPVAPVTSPDLAVVRLHGRSRAWGTGSKEDRFRHDYTPGELAPWVERVHAMAERTREVHVLFNNCCADAAVRAAGTMAGLLGLDPRPDPDPAEDRAEDRVEELTLDLGLDLDG
ncbi:uncharacterized protein YecE (DUF72 family) [Kitasatospora sp. SolWspMP-SS2h]|uniref:DUF72 domain-containing protein n=1 Tax=Kitasatospora sp. SolWspMP-SS2h TaxID=1305729 RepID=UPI000DBA35B6|nr:DUF72 domain-containing protein [Kitasatospora sp. SolWspMP-SS2h]RAJ37532.1 uncharacterized protein YecE (DUF72 family) [Kitasatospora sp. SolWspMP-SS2h]